MVDQPYAAALTCSRCGTTVHNDSLDIKDPLQFLAALRARGWSIPAGGGVHSNKHLCPTCANL